MRCDWRRSSLRKDGQNPTNVKISPHAIEVIDGMSTRSADMALRIFVLVSCLFACVIVRQTIAEAGTCQPPSFSY